MYTFIYNIRGIWGGIIGVFFIFLHPFSGNPGNAGVTDHFQVYAYLHLIHLLHLLNLSGLK